jgi:hypothetical protein
MQYRTSTRPWLIVHTPAAKERECRNRKLELIMRRANAGTVRQKGGPLGVLITGRCPIIAELWTGALPRHELAAAALCPQLSVRGNLQRRCKIQKHGQPLSARSARVTTSVTPAAGKVSDWTMTRTTGVGAPGDAGGRGDINATQPQLSAAGCKIKVRCISHDQDNSWRRLHDSARRPFSFQPSSLPEGRYQPFVWWFRFSKANLDRHLLHPPLYRVPQQ